MQAVGLLKQAELWGRASYPREGRLHAGAEMSERQQQKWEISQEDNSSWSPPGGASVGSMTCSYYPFQHPFSYFRFKWANYCIPKMKPSFVLGEKRWTCHMREIYHLYGYGNTGNTSSCTTPRDHLTSSTGILMPRPASHIPPNILCLTYHQLPMQLDYEVASCIN